MNDTLSQIKSFYEGLEPGRQKILIGAVAISLMGLVGVGLWSNQERYGSVYSSADPRQVQATASALEAAGLDYRVSQDGTRLEVPQAQLGAARLEAAASGQPTGLDILGGIELGTSPQQERWFQGYALQQEIQSSINSIEVVEASRVHIVQPNRVNFFSRDTTASASVVLELRAGTELNRSQIAGIANLITGAVHGLSSQDVALVDTEGNLLHPTSGSGAEAIAQSVSEAEIAEEGSLQGKIIESLLPMLGHPRHIAAAVTVEMDSSTISRTSKNIDPNSGVPVSTEIHEEESSDGAPARGIPGAESNLPEQAAETGGGALTETLQEVTNFDYSRTTMVETIPAGRTTRVSTSVTIDVQALQRLLDAAGGTEDMASLQKKVQEIIQGAVGFNAERGDAIEVGFVPFVAFEAEEISPFSTATWHIRQLLPSVITGLAVIMFFLFVARPIVAQMVKPASAGREDEGSDGAENDDESASELVKRMRALAEGDDSIDSVELNRLTTTHEEPAAQVLRRWLKAS